MVPGRGLRIDLGRRDNAPGSARRASRGTVARYPRGRARGFPLPGSAVPPRGRARGRGRQFQAVGPTALVFEGEDGIVGAYADLPATWTEQRAHRPARRDLPPPPFGRHGFAPRLLYPQEVGDPLRLTFEDCLRHEERILDRKIRKACQGITRLRPRVRPPRRRPTSDCLKVNIEG